MKINNYLKSLERGSCHALKLDPFLTGMVLGGIGSIANGLLGRSSQKEANETNINIAKMNNDAMLQANRENNQWNRATALEMFNKENEYNDPSAVRARLEAAGFNPSVAMGNGSQFTTAGQVDTPTASPIPSFQQATVAPLQSPMVGMFDAIQKYSSAMTQLAQAKKAGVETTQLEKSMNEYLRGLQLDNEAKDIANSVNSAFAMQERTAQVAKLHQEVLKTIEDVSLAKKQNDGVALDNAIKHIQKLMDDKRLSYLPKELDQKLRNLQAEERAINASASASSASASLSKAQESRLSQPFQGLNLSDEQKEQLANVMYKASIKDNEARRLLSEIEAQGNKWSQDKVSTLFRWLSQKIDDFPVVRNILSALKEGKKLIK